MKKSNIVSDKAEKLNKKIRDLQARLKDAKDFIAAIKTKNIDALVVPGQHGLKVFTEKASDKPYRILIEEMHEGAITTNEDGIILYCNSCFASMVKLPLQKVIGSNLKNYVKNSFHENSDTTLHLSRRKPSREEVYLHPQRGKPVTVMMSLSILSSHGKKRVVGIVLTNLTIQNKHREEMSLKATQLEEKNVELESANRDLLSFTYVSSHDLQEPLRKIQNFVNRLIEEESQTLTEKGKNNLQRTYETATRMRALIDDLLSYSNTKTSDRRFEYTNLQTIVDEVKKDFEELIMEKNAMVDTSQLGSAYVIRFQFHQLIDNLISNSLKFSQALTAPMIVIQSNIEHGGKLNGSGSVETDYCHITYTDNGIGFDDKYKDRIFEVFQRLHGHDEYQGTGMGLAICKRIIENHKGIITATGTLNKGVRLDVYLPVLLKGA